MSATRLAAVIALAQLAWGLGCTSPRGQQTATGGTTTAGSASGGSSSGGSSSGGVSSTSTSSGGSLDAGCHHLGQVAELGACVLSVDCACPLLCVPDPQGELLCQLVCAADADCGPDATCDAGSCQALPACDPVAGTFEFQACQEISDCACPLGCFEDGRLGKVCEHPCRSESDCLDAGQFCESDAGSCQVATAACNPGLGGKGEVEPCAQVSDCSCPLGCFQDVLRGKVCEVPCRSQADCAATGGQCDIDAGGCVTQCDPTGAPEFGYCTQSTQCACPFTCLFNSYGNGVCLTCEDGGCPAPAGSCVDAGAEAAASQNGFPILASRLGLTSCTSNRDCDCPNQCLPLPVRGGLEFVCRPPLPTCAHNADCGDPTTACLFGVCLPNFCVPDMAMGEACDLANALESVPDAGGGECLPDPRGSPLLICTAGGDGGAGCSLTPDRAQLDALCPAGSICIAGDAGSFCASGCSPYTLTCDGGGSCALFDPAVAQQCLDCVPLSVCLPEQQGCVSDLATYLPEGGPFDASSVGTEYAPCEEEDCLCPLLCNPDPVLAVVGVSYSTGFCERTCQTNADCPLSLTGCANGACEFDQGGCGGDGGLGLGSPCDAGDGTGTCVYFSPFAAQNWSEGVPRTTLPAAVCRLNGAASDVCGPLATRGAADLCGAGADCLPLVDGGFGCQVLCDPRSDAGGCGSGQACVPVTFNSDGIDEGTCLDLGDGGCALGLADDELAACQSNADCACGLGCLKDWSSNTLRCQRPCSVPADCPLDEVCFGEAGKRSCQLNTCGGSGAICTADLGADGTCLVEPASAIPPGVLPREPPETMDLWFACLQAGTATGACDLSADRSRPDLLCVPGTICDSSGSSPTCTPLCIVGGLDLSGIAPCPSGQYCVPLVAYQSEPATYFAPGSGRSLSQLQGSCLPAFGVDAGP